MSEALFLGVSWTKKKKKLAENQRRSILPCQGGPRLDAEIVATECRSEESDKVNARYFRFIRGDSDAGSTTQLHARPRERTINATSSSVCESRPHRPERSLDRLRDALGARARPETRESTPRHIASWREPFEDELFFNCAGPWCPARIPDGPSRRLGWRTPEVRHSRAAKARDSPESPRTTRIHPPRPPRRQPVASRVCPTIDRPRIVARAADPRSSPFATHQMKRCAGSASTTRRRTCCGRVCARAGYVADPVFSRVSEPGAFLVTRLFTPRV